MEAPFVATLEKEFKLEPCGETLLSLARFLIHRHPESSKPHRRGLQLIHRCIKQFDDHRARTELARYYSWHGNSEQRKQIIPLLETVLRQEPCIGDRFEVGSIIFYGGFPGSNKHRGLFLMQQAVSMWSNVPSNIACDLARALLSYDGSARSKKRAAALCDRVDVEVSYDVMYVLSDAFETGTNVMEPCARCARKWRRRAEQVEKKYENSWYFHGS